jgi:hypothetical protein
MEDGDAVMKPKMEADSQGFALFSETPTAL